MTTFASRNAPEVYDSDTDTEYGKLRARVLAQVFVRFFHMQISSILNLTSSHVRV